LKSSCFSEKIMWKTPFRDICHRQHLFVSVGERKKDIFVTTSFTARTVYCEILYRL